MQSPVFGFSPCFCLIQVALYLLSVNRTNTLRNQLACLVLLTFYGIGCNSNNGSLGNLDPEIEAIISQLTLEQKVGQMTQLNLGFLSNSVQQHDGKRKQVEWEKVKEAIHDYHIGSILNSNGYAKSFEEWHEIINGIQDLAMNEEPSIPILYGIDAIHGATYIKDAVLMPHNIAMAATRDRALIRRSAQLTAQSTRASGIRWNFDPVFDVGREPLWPRFEETFGESAYLCGQMGSEVVRAYEGQELDAGIGVASCLKHFIGYSVPASGKDRTEAYISNLELWEQHIASFQAGVDAGASTVMVNSASVNGLPIHSSRYHLTELLRDKMGFEGMIVSDWEDVIRLHTRHKVARNAREAVKMSIQAGLDMSMVPNDYSFYHHLVDLVKANEIQVSRIDESVRRILTLKKKIGLFKHPKVEKNLMQSLSLEDDFKLAKEVSDASIVLLENHGNTLPLENDERIFVAGPACCSKPALHGGWSYSWQGRDESIYPESTETVVQGLREEFGENRIACPVEQAFGSSDHYKIDFAKAARDCDVIVLCLGEDAYAETPGVIDDLTLPAEQIKLAQAALKTGKPVVLLMLEGRGRLIHEIAESADAILLAMRPGTAGAKSIAQVMSGRVNPGGVLPFTYHRNSGDIIPHDHRFLSKYSRRSPGPLTEKGFQPQWPLGHGLTFSDLQTKIDTIRIPSNHLKDSVIIEYTVANASIRDATQAIDVFVTDEYAAGISPRIRVHVGFDKIQAPAKSEVKNSFKIAPRSFQFVDSEGIFHSEAGLFTIELAGEMRTIELSP